ncbi:DUF4386 domain-containing protein [Bacteroidota bacterium]
MDNKVFTFKKTARLAGFMFLFYIAISFISMAISNQVTSGAYGVEAKLASIAQHVPLVHLSALLCLLTFFVATVLAVALYVLTRNQNPYIALLALCCRVAEGMIIAFSAVWTLGLLSVATASTVEAAPASAAAQALGDFLLQQDGSSILVSSICFAVGSTLYSYLFLRARSIPVLLAWFGLFASILLVVALPLQLLGFLPEAVNIFIWLPMLVFEVTFALWLLIKGVTAPVTQ